ncbi:hypothetical protein [Pararhizobium sp.]|uniref:hypothetical protein n=1 Tax=Pararhizobium sp. TaxID=1977563 RepID=UPI002725927D|nr:hypothetical protein [Pararhizobium sp.]MDO9416340.1 hypothetical protein [Pararhizobium sp.]
MTPDERRQAWDRMTGAKHAFGLAVDEDPVFLSWIEAWIAGTITMAEVSNRYIALVRNRRQSGAVSRTTGSILAQILKDVPDLRSIKVRDPAERSRSTRAIEQAWSGDE